MSKIDNKIGHNIVKVIGGAIIQGVAEGEEELCTEIINTLVDNYISGDLSHMELSVKEKMLAGYSEEEAIALTMKENEEQIMLAFLGGFVSGGVNGGVFTTIGAIKSENNISNISQNIMDMYNDSTFNYNIKEIQSNLRTNKYAEALNCLLNISGVDMVNNLLASQMLFNSLQNGNYLNASQSIEIAKVLDNGIQNFLNLSQEQQIEQFVKLQLTDQATLLNMLNSKGVEIFNGLQSDLQQNLFNKSTMNFQTKLSILSSLDTSSQNALLPDGVNMTTFIARNSSEIINMQVSAIDSSISNVVAQVKTLLFDSKFQFVNEFNINQFESLVAKAIENPSNISALVNKYSGMLDSSNVDTFNQLISNLSVKINDRYELTSAKSAASAIANKYGNIDYSTVLASLILPSELYNSLGLDSKIQNCVLFNNLVGEQLSSWTLTVESAASLYENLAVACNNAGIQFADLKNSIGIMEAMVKYYEDARVLEVETGGEIFNTYRTHGIVHIFDVMTQSINAYASFNSAGINNLSLETIMLSAVMHDTGMSGGQQIHLTKDAAGNLVITTQQVDSSGKAYRESHSFNSAVNILNEFEALRKAGYTDLQIAEAALLTFAHSKSNSGLNPLTGNVSGWSFAIQALAKATEGSDFNIVDVLVENGKLSSSNITDYSSVEIKTPTGNVKGNIGNFDIDTDWLNVMSYEGLIVRLGDALTNNDNAGINQYGKEITFENTDYNLQHDIANVFAELGIDSTLSFQEQFAILMTTEDFGLGKAAGKEAGNIVYKIDGQKATSSQQFVLGENNQTYSIRNAADGAVEVVISVKHSEAVPLCTLFAIDERLQEINSKGSGVFGDADSKNIRMVIEIDSSTTDSVKNLYQQYAEFAKDNGLVPVEINEVSNLAKITDPAVFEAGLKNGTITLEQMLNAYDLKNTDVYKRYEIQVYDKLVDDAKYDKAKANGVSKEHVVLSNNQLQAIRLTTKFKCYENFVKLILLEKSSGLKSGISVEMAAELLMNGAKQETILSDSYLKKYWDSWNANSITGETEVVAFKPGWAYDDFVVGKNTIGRSDGEFVLPKSEVQAIIKECTVAGKIDGEKLAEKLKLPLGTFKTGVVMVTQFVNITDLKLPTSNLGGSMLGEWVPGGKTGGGVFEAVVPQLILKDGKWVNPEGKEIKIDVFDFRI